MAQYICQECARSKELLPKVVGSRFTDTEYQLEKYIKHTAPKNTYRYNTIFKDPSTAMYSTYVVSTLADGYVEIDDRDRINVNYFASATSGYAISMGHAEGPVSGVKVVLGNDPEKIHAFPVDVSNIEVIRCDVCGKEIIHDKPFA
jgi:hypothetical protein